jgi:ribosomal protein L18E
MPLIRRVPKRGFHNLFRKEFAIVNVGRLEKVSGDEVSPQGLLKSGVISTLHNGLKILGDGELTRALKVSAHRVSKSAREKIEAAGGKIELLTVLEPVRRKAEPEPADAEGAAKAAKAKAAKPAKAKPAARPAAKAKPAKPQAAPKKAAEAKPSKPAKKAAKGKTGGDAKKK